MELAGIVGIIVGCLLLLVIVFVMYKYRRQIADFIYGGGDSQEEPLRGPEEKSNIKGGAANVLPGSNSVASSNGQESALTALELNGGPGIPDEDKNDGQSSSSSSGNESSLSNSIASSNGQGVGSMVHGSNGNFGIPGVRQSIPSSNDGDSLAHQHGPEPYESQDVHPVSNILGSPVIVGPNGDNRSGTMAPSASSYAIVTSLPQEYASATREEQPKIIAREVQRFAAQPTSENIARLQILSTVAGFEFSSREEKKEPVHFTPPTKQEIAKTRQKGYSSFWLSAKTVNELMSDIGTDIPPSIYDNPVLRSAYIAGQEEGYESRKKQEQNKFNKFSGTILGKRG